VIGGAFSGVRRKQMNKTSVTLQMLELIGEEMSRLDSVNAELLEALNLIANTGMDAKQCRDYAISAIAKAQE
jgi:hypothetical protein